MQQIIKNVVITSHLKEIFPVGKCLLQMLKPDFLERSKRIPISYEYNREQGFIIFQYEEDSDMSLLHASTCPCEKKHWIQKDGHTLKHISLSVAGIVRDSNYNYLLTRRHQKMRTFPSAWVFPGGMVDNGGELESEIKREIHEETGIQITNQDIISKIAFYESIYPTVLIGYPQRQTVVLFFLVQMSRTKEEIPIIVSDDEVDKFQWVSQEELIKAINQEQDANPEIIGKYPNQIGQGLGEGHKIVLEYLLLQKDHQ